jgi:uncharacterized protein involved in exopolysaccharide biosynthesis
MTSRDPNLAVDRDPVGDDEDEGLDLEQVRERLGFALRAPRRRPKLAVAVFVIVAAIGITISIVMPRTYNVQVKVLTQRNAPGFVSAGRNIPREMENPSKNLAEIIVRRDSLVALAKDVDLVNRFYGSRTAALRLKDSVMGAPKDDEERLAVMVKTLQKKLNVWSDDTSVNIGLDWSDPQMAYDLVEHIQQNLLDAKYDDEVSMLNDAMAILVEHEKTERQNVDFALDEYQKTLEEQRQKLLAGRLPPAIAPRPGGGGGGVVVPRPAASIAPAVIDPDLVAALEEKRRQIRSLEEERQRELDGLRQQLTQAQLTLTPQHPTVISLQQQIQARSQPSAELIQAKAEERELAARIAAASAPPLGSTTAPGAPLRVPVVGALPAPLPAIPALPRELESDGRTLLAKSKLDGAIHGYQEVEGRIAATNIELDIAKSAFKYRYTVITPAEVPRGPKKPIATFVGVGSVVGAALLAVLFAAIADLLQGRVLESWQVRRRLKLDVLGELDAP